MLILTAEYLAKKKRIEYNGNTIIYTKEKHMGKVRLNSDAEVVKLVKEGLKAKGGYCPCRLEKKEEYKCICEEFKAQIADPNFEGYCHCMLYYKEK